MPTKRQLRNRGTRPRVTAEAVAAYEAGDHAALAAELKLPSWHISPLDATGKCPYPEGTAGAMTWEAAGDLRGELARMTKEGTDEDA